MFVLDSPAQRFFPHSSGKPFFSLQRVFPFVFFFDTAPEMPPSFPYLFLWCVLPEIWSTPSLFVMLAPSHTPTVPPRSRFSFTENKNWFLLGAAFLRDAIVDFLWPLAVLLAILLEAVVSPSFLLRGYLPSTSTVPITPFTQGPPFFDPSSLVQALAFYLDTFLQGLSSRQTCEKKK